MGVVGVTPIDRDLSQRRPNTVQFDTGCWVSCKRDTVEWRQEERDEGGGEEGSGQVQSTYTEYVRET